jgi:hypothetical protein
MKEVTDGPEQRMGGEGEHLCAWRHGQSTLSGNRPIVEKVQPQQLLAAVFAAFPNMPPKMSQQARLCAQRFGCTDDKVASAKALSYLSKREVPVILQQSMKAAFISWMVCSYSLPVYVGVLVSTGSGMKYSTQVHCQT